MYACRAVFQVLIGHAAHFVERASFSLCCHISLYLHTCSYLVSSPVSPLLSLRGITKIIQELLIFTVYVCC